MASFVAADDGAVRRASPRLPATVPAQSEGSGAPDAWFPVRVTAKATAKTATIAAAAPAASHRREDCDARRTLSHAGTDRQPLPPPDPLPPADPLADRGTGCRGLRPRRPHRSSQPDSRRSRRGIRRAPIAPRRPHHGVAASAGAAPATGSLPPATRPRPRQAHSAAACCQASSAPSRCGAAVAR